MAQGVQPLQKGGVFTVRNAGKLCYGFIPPLRNELKSA